MSTAIAREGETVDEVCWRTLGRTRAVTEQVLAMNPGLAGLGRRLPAGTVLLLPELTQTAPAILETVKLWD